MERRIHVCHVQSTFQSGGLENGVVNIVNGRLGANVGAAITCVQLMRWIRSTTSTMNPI